MISFDLKCDSGHIFEGWFRSSADYEAQRTAGQVVCPVCGDHGVVKAVMAPAVAAKGNKRAEAGSLTANQPDTPAIKEETAQKIMSLLEEVAKSQAASLKDSLWVGAAFTERARAMHYGEADHAIIHGTANAQDARAMIEEGLSVMPLLVPIAPPDQIN
jgi:hypothetical protein